LPGSLFLNQYIGLPTLGGYHYFLIEKSNTMMYNKNIAYFSLISAILLLLVGSCRTVHPDPPPPTDSTRVLVPPHSEIVFPIQYKVSELEALLNEKITGTFVNAWIQLDQRGDSAQLVVTKSGPIRVKWNMPKLQVSVPLHLEGKFNVKLGDLNVKNKKPIVSDIVLQLSSDVGIKENWQLDLKSNIDTIHWLKNPELKILFISVDLQKKIDNLIRNKSPELIAKMDDAISKKLNVRKSISKLWRDIQKPIRINRKEVPFWLQIRCDSVRSKWLDSGDSILAIQLRVKTKTQILFDPDHYPMNPTLPPYREYKEDISDSIHLFLYSRIPFSLINEQLNQRLADSSLRHRLSMLKINELQVYGIDSNKIAVRVNVKGNVRGDLYLKGGIHFDTVRKVLRVDNFAFDVDTENDLLRGADWAFNSTLRDVVGSKLQFELDSLIQQIPTLMVAGIERSKVGHKIDVSVPNLQILSHDMITTKNDIQMIIQLYGVGQLELEKAVFMKNKKKLRIVKPKSTSG
jgi:hypothetical protein